MNNLTPTVGTNIQIGSSDLTSMLIQRHLDGMALEAATLKEERKAHYGVLEEALEVRKALLNEEFKRKSPEIDAFALAVRRLYKLSGKTFQDFEVVFQKGQGPGVGQVFGCYHITEAEIKFKEKEWTEPWYFRTLPEGDSSEDSDAYDYIDDFRTNSSVLGSPLLYEISVKIPAEWRTKIQAALNGINGVDKKTAAIREQRKDIPALERLVSARLTEQLLTSQPELLRTLNAVLTSSGSTLLLSGAGGK